MGFYDELESGVRKWVKILRQYGLNTECSCHHEGYIQCQSIDIVTEVDRIQNALNGAGLQDYTIIVTYTKIGESYFQSLEVRSKAFKI